MAVLLAGRLAVALRHILILTRNGLGQQARICCRGGLSTKPMPRSRASIPALSSMEQAAAKAARGASAGIDGLTVSMVKGATTGNLLADAIKHAIEWIEEWPSRRQSRRRPAIPTQSAESERTGSQLSCLTRLRSCEALPGSGLRNPRPRGGR